MTNGNNKHNDKTLDELFDEGADMTQFMVEDSVKKPNKVRKINLNMPSWMIDELDDTAAHLAISRQAVINIWIAERLQQEKSA